MAYEPEPDWFGGNSVAQAEPEPDWFAAPTLPAPQLASAPEPPPDAALSELLATTDKVRSANAPAEPQQSTGDDYYQRLLQQNEANKRNLLASGVPEDQLNESIAQQNLQAGAQMELANEPGNAVGNSLLSRVPKNIVTNLGSHAASIAGMVESGLASIAPDSVQEFLQRGREDIRNYQRVKDARDLELDKQGALGETATGTIRQVSQGLGEAAALAPTGIGGMAAFFGLARASEGLTDGESPELAATHGVIDAAWTYVGGRLLGAGTGKLAGETGGVGAKAAQWTAKKLRLPTATAPIIEGSGGQALQGLGQEASNYLADVAAGKHEFHRDDFIRRMTSVAGQSALLGAAGAGTHLALQKWAGTVADTVESRMRDMPTVAKAIGDAEKFTGEVPPTSRRGFEKATGQENTNKTYREAFADEVRSRTELPQPQEQTNAKEIQQQEVGQEGQQVEGPVRQEVLSDGPTPMPGPNPASPEALRFAQAVPMDDVIKDARHGLNRVKALLKRGFLGQGTLPTDIYTEKLIKDSRIASDLKQIDFGVRDYDAALKKVYGGRNYLPATERAKLSAVLKGELPADSIAPELREPVTKMRAHIDALSRKMIESGAAEGPVSLTIAENMGAYVTRSYRVFDDPVWARKVPEVVRNRAKAALRAEHPDSTPQQIDHAIESLLYAGKAADTPIAVLSRAKLGSKDLSVLMERKDLPEWLRTLWGEYDDPVVQYARSTTKMAHLIGNHQFLTTVRKEGLGRYFFEKSDPNIDPDAKAQISADGSKTMAPLNGLWTYPEIKAAFEREYSPSETSWLMRNYLRVNGMVKLGKTVLSPVTQIRNFGGNFLFDWLAGVRPGEGVKGLKAAAPGIESILGATGEATRAEHTRLIELGVIDEGVNASELRQAISDAADMQPDQFSERTIERGLAKSKKATTDLYQFSDAAHRVMGFYALRRQYGEAFPEMSPAQVDAKAAETVARIYPTYSRVGEGVRKLGSRVPLVGTFVQFPAEVIRTAMSTVKLIQEELADPKTRQLGANRLARLAATVAVPIAASAASRMFTGISKDDENDARRFLPPWSENADLLWFTRDKDGSLRYVDASYSDPHSYLKKPVRALLRGDSPTGGAADAVGEAAAPFAGEEILAGKLIDLARNKTADGRTVYNPQAPAKEQLSNAWQHVWEALEPGAVTSLKRISKGVTGEVEQTGRGYNTADEIAALVTGTRMQKIDVRRSIGFKAYRYSKEVQDARNIFTSIANSRGTVSEDQISQSYAQAQQAERAIFDKIHEDAMAAMRLGVPESDVRAAIADAAGKRNAAEIMAGIYIPYRPSPETMRAIAKGIGGPERLNLVLRIIQPAATPVPESAAMPTAPR